MKWKNVALLLGGLSIGLLMGFIIIRGSGGTSAEGDTPASRRSIPSRGLPIADFELNALTGERVKLSQFRGQAVVINFWGTWCPPCRNEMPLFQTVFETYQPDLVILAVNVNDAVGSVERYVEEMGLTFPILLDENGDVRSQFQVRGFPTTYFVDREGVLREQSIGELDQSQMDDYLAKIGVAP
jgi:cytochrome c biogenesis protein CcmG, thiol:disulfide interchange protein DsbE